jgi:hypothetical protein
VCYHVHWKVCGPTVEVQALVTPAGGNAVGRRTVDGIANSTIDTQWRSAKALWNVHGKADVYINVVGPNAPGPWRGNSADLIAYGASE